MDEIHRDLREALGISEFASSAAMWEWVDEMPGYRLAAGCWVRWTDEEQRALQMWLGGLEDTQV